MLLAHRLIALGGLAALAAVADAAVNSTEGLRGHGDLCAADVLDDVGAAPPAAVRHAEMRLALRRLDAAGVVAATPAAVAFAQVLPPRGAAGAWIALVVRLLASPAASVPRAALGGALRQLCAVSEGASPTPAMLGAPVAPPLWRTPPTNAKRAQRRRRCGRAAAALKE